MASLSQGTSHEKCGQHTSEVTTSIEFTHQGRRAKDPKHLQAQLEPTVKKTKQAHLFPSAVRDGPSSLSQATAPAPERKRRRARESSGDLPRSRQPHEFRTPDRLNLASGSDASERNAKTSDQVLQQDESGACRRTHRDDISNGARELDYKPGGSDTLEGINVQISWSKRKRTIPEDSLSRNACLDNYDDLRRGRRGVADDDTRSVATSVEGEFFTPLAAARTGLPSDDSRIFRETTPIIPSSSQTPTMFGYVL